MNLSHNQAKFFAEFSKTHTLDRRGPAWVFATDRKEYLALVKRAGKAGIEVSGSENPTSGIYTIKPAN